ncbi:IdeS/Mac family cysteine endopeptidase [Treponema socranskii]|uniref:IdeS/Mac family cysteine endopeptidase n=1 Tax=Treponema socranskii TaxID=53419 RepID=UPI003D6EBBCE
MIYNIKYLFKNKNKTILFAAIAALLFLSCANDLSKTDTAVTGIVIPSGETTIFVENGGARQIGAYVLPENATNKKLTYNIDDDSVASVTADGLITAKAVGNAHIIIKAADGISKTVNLTVTAATIHVTSIEFEEEPANPVELIIGESYELKLKVMPDDAANKELRITSSDGKIAWPNGNGNRWIKADGAVGDAIVTITSVDNPFVKKEVHFKTKEQPAGPSISIEKLSVSYGSDEADVTFTVKTLNGKLNYTPEVVGGGTGEKVWLTFVRKDETNKNTDTVRLHLKKNKTVWARTAYIKFKDNNTHNYVKAAGKDLQVKIIQKKNEHPVVTIKWVDGITEPGASEKNPIQIVGSNPGDNHNIDYVFTWNETSTTKFFNARKVDYTNPPNNGRRDSKQCWAKTDSNMLHWWFVQNENNINQYITKKNITEENNAEMYKMYKPVYKRGIANDQEPQKSTIANLFRAKCKNWGGDPAMGLQWYLFGLDNFENADDKSYSPALFPDVFNTANTPIKRERIYTKKLFEDMLKDALGSKKAIGINLDKSSGEAHAITLWGAAFDGDNNIIAVYVVDNNDGANNMVFPYGIRYKDEVDIYIEADIHNPYYDQHHFKPYLFNFSANAKMDYYIGEITTLDKGEAQWAEWFRTHP